MTFWLETAAAVGIWLGLIVWAIAGGLGFGRDRFDVDASGHYLGCLCRECMNRQAGGRDVTLTRARRRARARRRDPRPW